MTRIVLKKDNNLTPGEWSSFMTSFIKSNFVAGIITFPSPGKIHMTDGCIEYGIRVDKDTYFESRTIFPKIIFTQKVSHLTTVRVKYYDYHRFGLCEQDDDEVCDDCRNGISEKPQTLVYDIMPQLLAKVL